MSLTYESALIQEGQAAWQPSDLLPLKVYRQYPRKFAAPQPQRDPSVAATAEGRPATREEHVRKLLAQAQQAEECVSAQVYLLWCPSCIVSCSPAFCITSSVRQHSKGLHRASDCAASCLLLPPPLACASLCTPAACRAACMQNPLNA